MRHTGTIPVMERSRGWAIALMTVSLLRGWSSEPKLTLLLPSALSDPLPVRIEASPVVETRTDSLEWRTRGVVYRLPIPRTPNAPVRREALCYTLMLQRGLSQTPLFYWRGEGGIEPIDYDAMPRGVGVVLVGDLAGGYEFLQRIHYAPITLPGSAPELNPESFPLTPIYLRPQELPDHPAALLGVPCVVLLDGAERLSEAQWRALLLWMHTGGTLLLSVNVSAFLLQRTPLAPYLPNWITPRRTPLQQPIALRGRSLPPPSQPVPTAFLNLTRGQPLATVGEHTLAAEIPYGYGRLAVFGGDLTHPAWRNWQGQMALWTILLQRPQPPLRALTESDDIGTRRSSQQTASDLPAFLTICAVLAGYVAALYALWRMLRTMRRLIYAPYGVAGLSALAVIALYFITPTETRSALLWGERRIVCIGDTALEYGLWRYDAPSGEWTLRWQGVDALAVEPIAALNPIEVEFTGQGATLRSGSLIPAVIRLHTLRRTPAPLRLQKTPRGYELLNASENLTFETVRVARRMPTSNTNADFEETLDWRPFHMRRLAPNETMPLPLDPAQDCVIHAAVWGDSGKGQVEVWLFLP